MVPLRLFQRFRLPASRPTTPGKSANGVSSSEPNPKGVIGRANPNTRNKERPPPRKSASITGDRRRQGFAKLPLSKLDTEFSGRVFISTPIGNRGALGLLGHSGMGEGLRNSGRVADEYGLSFFFRDM